MEMLPQLCSYGTSCMCAIYSFYFNDYLIIEIRIFNFLIRLTMLRLMLLISGITS